MLMDSLSNTAESTGLYNFNFDKNITYLQTILLLRPALHIFYFGH